MRDRALLNKLRTDPDEGMRVLIDRYAGLVQAVVRARLLSPPFCAADVEAAAADTFSEFYCGIDRYDPARGSIAAWLCVIARNKATDRLRRHYREKGVLPLEAVPPGLHTARMEDDVEERELRRELAEAIRRLTLPDREIIVRKYLLGQPTREIAAALHMSASNVDTRAHRAIRKLRSHMEEQGDGKETF